MSFLQDLQKKRLGLTPTKTVVTTADGKQFVEDGAERILLTTDNNGFVVDTKPDKVPSKIIPYLYLGSQDATDIAILKEYNITHVLSIGITFPYSTLEGSRIINKHIACLDLPDTSLEKVLQEAVNFIDAAIHEKNNILVHCNAGVSRSPAVVIAYLIRRHGMTYLGAHAHVKQLRPSIRPNDGFARQLQREYPP